MSKVHSLNLTFQYSIIRVNAITCEVLGGFQKSMKKKNELKSIIDLEIPIIVKI